MRRHKVIFPDGWLPKLVDDYLAGAPELAEFYGCSPSFDGLRSKLEGRRTMPIDRRKLVAVLRNQYEHAGLKVPEPVEVLHDPETFTVTTGHQLCLCTGPLYSIYKIASTIALARQLSDEFAIKVIPVFWMASEDHDFEEVNHFNLSDRRVVWEQRAGGPVGEMIIEDIGALLSQMDDPTLRALVEQAYSDGDLALCTRRLIAKLFNGTDLVIIDGNDPVLKASFAEHMIADLSGSEVVTDTSTALKAAGYKPQVSSRRTNLFYLNGGIRTRIIEKNGSFLTADDSTQWDRPALEAAIMKEPVKFSPNVVMRPLYQESVLPNLAYVGGPGELSYWLQLKALFSEHQVSFPVLVLRESMVLLDTEMQDQLAELGLSVEELLATEDDAIRAYITKASPTYADLKRELEQAIDSIERTRESVAGAAQEVRVAAEIEAVNQVKELKGMLKKMLRAEKKDRASEVDVIRALHARLFPQGKPQERHYNILEFSAADPSGLISELRKNLDPLDPGITIVELRS